MILTLFVIVIVGVNLQSCGSIQQPIQGTPTFTPAITLTPSPIPTATATLISTKTPIPTATPNLAATQQYEDFFSWVKNNSDESFVSSVNGKYYPVDDYSKSFAKIGYYSRENFDNLNATNFIIQANVKIANQTTENVFKSACGLVFEDQFSDYIIFFSLDGNTNYRINGGDGGSKYIDSALFQNPEGVKLTLIVNKNAFNFYVNDKMVFSQIPVYGGPFNIGTSVLSGTSEGFGTRCDFTKIAAWTMD